MILYFLINQTDYHKRMANSCRNYGEVAGKICIQNVRLQLIQCESPIKFNYHGQLIGKHSHPIRKYVKKFLQQWSTLPWAPKEVQGMFINSIHIVASVFNCWLQCCMVWQKTKKLDFLTNKVTMDEFEGDAVLSKGAVVYCRNIL